MTSKLTPKQRAFVASYVSGATATQAAIDAGYSKHSAKTIANNLATKNPLVRAELERISAQLSSKCEYNAQVAMSDLSIDISQAKEAGQHSAVAKFRELQMKLFGLLRDKLEVSVEKKIDIRGILDEANARAERYFAGMRPICDSADVVDGKFEALPSPAAARPIDGDSTDPAKWQPFGIDS